MHSDILVIGGGFAGLWAALAAAREIGVHGGGQTVTLISRDPYLTIRPRLYEARPQTLREPLAATLDPAGVAFLQGDASSIDPAARRVKVRPPDGTAYSVDYQRLILATGSRTRLPPVPGFAEHGWSIDDYDSAVAFDNHLETIVNASDAPGNQTYAIVGAGFTGIELACEMRDRIAVHAREGKAQNARIVLLERAGVVGPDLGPGPRDEIIKALDTAGVEFRASADITALHADHIGLATGESIATRTVVITTGLIANIPPGLEKEPRDPLGRLRTRDDLRLAGNETIFAAGDTAHACVDDANDSETKFALMSCQHAMPMGRFAGFNAAHDLLGMKLRTYRQHRYQTCLDLGRSGAVLTMGWEREVRKTGDDAGTLKRNINTKWIYPPTGSRDDIFAVADIDAPPVR